MEISASIAYGIVLTQETAEELINASAAYEASQEVPELEDEIDDYFEVDEDDEDDEEVEANYPAEALGRIAEFHPDYKGRLDYTALGNTATIDDDDSAILIFITSTYQEVEVFGPLNPLAEPSDEDIQLLHGFMSRFLTDVTDAPVPEWILGGSGS